MNNQAASNRAWLQAKLYEAGLTLGIEALAERIRNGEVRRPGSWSCDWAKAYSYGHNIVNLRNGRLNHFANAYADICEVFGHDIPFDRFYCEWDGGSIFEGTAGEHWYLS